MKKLILLLVLATGCINPQPMTTITHVVDVSNLSKDELITLYAKEFTRAENLQIKCDRLQNQIESMKFPWDVFLGFMSLGIVATLALFVTPFKALAPIAMAGFVTMATFACADQYKWQVTGGFILTVALTVILILLTKLKPFKELVTKLENSKATNPELAPVLKTVLKGNLTQETEKAIENVRDKAKKTTNGNTNSPTPGNTAAST